MGILYGNVLLDQVRCGLYARTCIKRAVLNVDGEFIRFKGMSNGNTVQSNAELVVARAAFRYLDSRCRRLERYLSYRFDKIIVYMDGKRVTNKAVRDHETIIDQGLARELFCELCTQNKYYKVVRLDVGESELQMYIMRDRNATLNVFITSDTDCIPIMYGHEATYRCGGEVAVYEDFELLAPPITPSLLMTTGTKNGEEIEIEDRNYEYNTRSRNGKADLFVSDSCLWVVCDSHTKSLRLIGFDDTHRRIGCSKLAFRALCALCGTDFTDSFLTPSMVRGFFMNLTEADKKSLSGCGLTITDYVDEKRELFDVCSIIIAILLAGLRSGGNIKALKRRSRRVDDASIDSTYDNYMDASETDDNLV